MDIKTGLSRYEEIIGADFSVEEDEKIKEIIQNSGLPYEFRNHGGKRKTYARQFLKK